MAQADLRRVAKARRKIGDATAELHEAIRIAYRSGESLRDIGRYAELSHQRIFQIVNEED